MFIKQLSGRQWNLLSCLVLICTGGILYGHTLTAPFYYDDFTNLVEQLPTQHNLHVFLGNSLGPRGIAKLTFALNYHYGALDVSGYHLINIFIHLIVSIMVFGTLTKLLPGSRGRSLTGALIFLAHPIQTQSVTYIIQRYTALSGLFLFCAMLLFCQAYRRLSRDGSVSATFFALYLTALLSGAASVLTKQNGAVLPLLLALAGYFFLEVHGRFRRLLTLVAPFFIAPLYQAYVQLAVPLNIKAGSTSAYYTISTLSQAADRAVETATPLTYLVTEFGVIWIYIRLLFLPYHQSLVYDWPMATRLVTLTNIASLTGIIALLATAVVLRSRNKMIACGILWFFVGLSVESTFIPLDPVFEHRLYVPLFGFILVLLGLIQMITSKRNVVAVCVFLIGGYGILTWQRNALWNNQTAFYEDSLKHAPGKTWIYVDLGKLYIEQKQFERAETLLKRATEIDPAYHKTYNNLGTLYSLTGKTDQALSAYRQAIAFNPLNAEAYTNIGTIQAGLKNWKEAMTAHTIAIRLKPEYALAWYNLGVAVYSMGDAKKSLESFRKSAELAPNDVDTIYNLILISAETGDSTSALKLIPRLTAISPARGRELASAIEQAKHAKHFEKIRENIKLK